MPAPAVRNDFSYAVAASPCGGVVATVNGAPALLRPSGALWLARSRTLVAADLHLEKGSAYAARGQLLPPYDTRETLNRLEAEVAALEPVTVVLLGDTLHDRRAQLRIDGDDASRLWRLAYGRRLVWVIGNHDADGPSGLPGEPVDEIGIDGLTLRHEPLVGVEPGEAAGHLHPCARIRGRAGSVRRRCFVTDGERIILPAFGAFAGGLNVKDVAFASLFARAPLAVALGVGQAHAIGWGALAGD